MDNGVFLIKYLALNIKRFWENDRKIKSWWNAHLLDWKIWSVYFIYFVRFTIKFLFPISSIYYCDNRFKFNSVLTRKRSKVLSRIRLACCCLYIFYKWVRYQIKYSYSVQYNAEIKNRNPISDSVLVSCIWNIERGFLLTIAFMDRAGYIQIVSDTKEILLFYFY